MEFCAIFVIPNFERQTGALGLILGLDYLSLQSPPSPAHFPIFLLYLASCRELRARGIKSGIGAI
jgi:hypothetical protein